jgi:hypothetical protein
VNDPIAWNTISGYHSQLTGVLAGFVFAALTLLLSTPPRGKSTREISEPLLMLLLVFLSLILASFLYAVATGERSPTGPVLSNMFASFIFSLAAVQMFLCLSWLFFEYGAAPVVLGGTHMVVEGVVLIAGVNILMTVGNAMVALEGRDYQQEWTTLLWSLPLLLPLVGHFQRKRARGHSANDMRRHRLTIHSFRFVLGAALLCGVLVSLSPDKRELVYQRWLKYPLMLLLGYLFHQCVVSLPPLDSPGEDATREVSPSR